ncbi:unnamed protein product, partial [Discosporangium mesarthrocarpum]
MASPEASSAYLQRSNFKPLMEWLTARCILHRPEDPMVFCRNLLSEKIEQNGGEGTPYDPSAISKSLKARECYDDAMNSADEHGIIRDMKNTRSQGSQESPQSTPTPASNGCNVEGAENIGPAARASIPEGGGGGGEEEMTDCREMKVGSISMEDPLLSVLQDMCELARPEPAATAVITGVCKVFNTHRATLYKVVDKEGSLREMGVGSVAKRRFISPGQGLVGRVAAAAMAAAAGGLAGARGSSNTPMDAIVIKDPYSEPGFLPTVDVPGWMPPGLMCGPLVDNEGGVVGVLVVAEKANGCAFNERDLGSFRQVAVSEVAAVCLRNAVLFVDKERECEKFRGMVEIIQATKDNMGLNHLLCTMSRCFPLICDAQKCTCYMVDDEMHELWAVQGEVNIRIPMGVGIVGAVAKSGEVINIKNAYEDHRFNKAVDVETGFKTSAILALPI